MNKKSEVNPPVDRQKSKLYSAIKNYFLHKPEVVAVYLYGSYARGEERKESDIDLAILVDKKLANSSDIGLKTMSDLGLLLHEEVEVQNLNICQITFAYRVISEGKVIYERSEKERINFEVMVMRNYFDLKPLIDEFSFNLRERAKQGLLAKPLYGVKI